MYFIVDGSGLNLAELEDQIFADRSTIFLATINLLFFDDNSHFIELCSRKFEDIEDVGMILKDWLAQYSHDISVRFDFLEGVRPFTPIDVVNQKDIFLIEMLRCKEMEDV